MSLKDRLAGLSPAKMIALLKQIEAYLKQHSAETEEAPGQDSLGPLSEADEASK